MKRFLGLIISILLFAGMAQAIPPFPPNSGDITAVGDVTSGAALGSGSDATIEAGIARFDGHPWTDITHGDYGADSTGVSDSAAAITAAIAATPVGGTLFIPNGKFKISTAISFNRQINIRGMGPGSILWIEGLAGSDAITFGPAAGYMYGVHWSDFAILGGATAAANGLVIRNVNNSQFDNIHVMLGSTVASVWLKTFGIINYYNFIISSNMISTYAVTPTIQAGKAIYASDAADAAGTFNANVFDCIIEGGPGYGLHVKSSTNNGNNVYQGTYEGIQGEFSILIEGGEGARVTNAHIEASTAASTNILKFLNHSYGFIGPSVVSLPFLTAGAAGYNDVQLFNADNIIIDGLRTNRLSEDATSDSLQIKSIWVVGGTDAAIAASGTNTLNVIRGTLAIRSLTGGIGALNITDNASGTAVIDNSNNSFLTIDSATRTSIDGVLHAMQADSVRVGLGTAATDAVNYNYLKILPAALAGATHTISIQTGGTGADDGSINLVPAGAGTVQVGGNTVLTAATAIDPDQISGDTVDDDKVDWAIVAPPVVQSVTCTDSGDGNPGTLTITPTAGLNRVAVSLTVSDADGCTITMAETGAVAETEVLITNISAANTATFTTSAGVLTLKHGSPYVMAAKETIALLYKTSEWLEVGRMSGTLNISTLNLPSSDANPGTTAGQIRHDSTDTDASASGSAKYFDGTNVRTVIDSGAAYTIVVRTEFLPVAYGEDGAAPPAAAAVLASTRKVRTRAFDGASNENVEWHWLVPDDYVGGVKFRFIGYVSSATAPANTEVVAFSLAGCSVANSEVLGCTAGTAQTSSLTADATYVQYDRIAGAWSSAITLTGIAAGESAHMILERLASTTDTYVQDFALAGIEIKYQSKIMLNSTY